MNIRNLLKPSDYVMLVPIGIELTLQYSTEGNLQKVYLGFNSKEHDISDPLIKHLKANKIIPASISVKRGITWIRGVLHTAKHFHKQGQLPLDIYDELMGYLLKTPEKFKFYAGTIESTSTPFSGYLNMKQGLTISKFRLLPGGVVPSRKMQEAIDSWKSRSNYPFDPDVVSSYIVLRGTEMHFFSSRLVQFYVQTVEKFTNEYGSIRATLYIDQNIPAMQLDYSDVHNFNIRKGATVILDREGKLVSVKFVKESASVSSERLVCERCGTVFMVPKSGKVRCSNIHCPTFLIPKINHFCTTLGIDKIPVERLLTLISNNKLTCIPDLLLLDEYNKSEPEFKIEVTLVKLLRAMVPLTTIPNIDVFIYFVDRCMNQIESFSHYISNPNNIKDDLNINDPALDNFITWLEDPFNISDLVGVLTSPQITVLKAERQPAGIPIFRGKTIYLTGDFIRGDIAYIKNLLESYSAKVTTVFDNLVDCVLVGGKQENINGSVLASAKGLNVTILYEDAFFKWYELDTHGGNLQ